MTKTLKKSLAIILSSSGLGALRVVNNAFICTKFSVASFDRIIPGEYPFSLEIKFRSQG